MTKSVSPQCPLRAVRSQRRTMCSVMAICRWERLGVRRAWMDSSWRSELPAPVGTEEKLGANTALRAQCANNSCRQTAKSMQSKSHSATTARSKTTARLVAFGARQPYHTADYLSRLRKYRGNTSTAPVSGHGSSVKATANLVSFLTRWLRNVSAESLVEASCGHWPTGWQASVQWPRLDYQGFDLIMEQIKDNRALVTRRGGPAAFGLRSMRFEQAELTRERLPPADVLLTKDTLIHWPNEAVLRFLDLNVLPCPPPFKRVLFVHDPLPWSSDGNTDVNVSGSSKFWFRPLDMHKPPFNLSHVVTVASWRVPGSYHAKKVVEELDAEARCERVRNQNV